MAKKKIRVAINGFGRIGRLFFRHAFEHPGIDIVAVNDLGDIENLAYLLKYDSVYRTYDKSVEFVRDANGTGGILMVDGKKVQVTEEKELAKLPWGALKIDVAV